jgi:nucleoside-diphosphate-sugar epimerase
MHVLIAGCGWLGGAVARELVARGDRVTGVRSSDASAEPLRAMGIEPCILDLSEPEAADRLPPGVEAILALQSAKGKGEAPYRRAYLDVNRTLLEVASRQRVRAMVYTGSTGLFGQTDGSDVEEDTAPAPTTPEGRILLEAEAQLRAAAARGVPARILRLSGLYGPGRLWMLEAVAKGVMTLGPGDDAFLNACHQADAVSAVLAVLDRGRDGGIYHATDARPCRRREVIAFIAERLGIPVGTSAAGLAPSAPNRRILGTRTREELGLRLRWPSVLEGLAPFLPPGGC